MAAREAYSRWGVRGHVWAPQTKVRRPACLARYVARRRGRQRSRWALIIALAAPQLLEHRKPAVEGGLRRRLGLGRRGPRVAGRLRGAGVARAGHRARGGAVLALAPTSSSARSGSCRA